MALERIMFLWILLLGSVLSTPADEFEEITNSGVGDFAQKGDISNILPSRFISSEQRSRFSTLDTNEWSELLKHNQGNIYFGLFNKHILKGATAKDLTFCIYDDNLRDAAIALFRLFQNTVGETFIKVREWAKKHVNTEMFMYALRLESVFSSKTNDSTLLPPFIWNPNFFVNSESLTKASMAANDLSTDEMVVNKISKIGSNYEPYKVKEFVIINSNYSGWNLRKIAKDNLLNYFREDIGLNSYYLGIHLLHPFWMSNEELEFLNPRFAEHYYYAHQQLMARYNLEKQHILAESTSYLFDTWDYVPYLKYKNGLPFPTRSCQLGDWNDEEAYLKTIDIAIRECISRGLIIMQNGETIAMTDDSHINILARLIRANLDSIKFAKIARSVAGYRANAYPINEYNPAPSTLHHPETSLKDPAYWLMIHHMLNYFTDYKSTMEPFNISLCETSELDILQNNFSKFITYFDYYSFPVNNALGKHIKDPNDWSAFVAVRQRRLRHVDFSLNFTVQSLEDQDVIVRLYLGPECYGQSCWDQYNKFFELDTFRFFLKEGSNYITWSPKNSERLSFDEDYNSVVPKAGSSKYSIFRFPENLLIPRGLENGLNMTLFIMISPKNQSDEWNSNHRSFYGQVSYEFDSKPLGFPFHRQAKGFRDLAYNYRFFNITVYHKAQPVDAIGYFSPHLY